MDARFYITGYKTTLILVIGKKSVFVKKEYYLSYFLFCLDFGVVDMDI